jgi:hypothetical protein
VSERVTFKGERAASPGCALEARSEHFNSRAGAFWVVRGEFWCKRRSGAGWFCTRKVHTEGPHVATIEYSLTGLDPLTVLQRWYEEG